MYVVIVFSKTKQMIIYICFYIRNLENSRLKPVFRYTIFICNVVHCWQVEDTKWILCCRKIGVKCAYLRFLMYKRYFIIDKQIARHFVQYTECLYATLPIPFYVTQFLDPFLNLRILTNHDKGKGF